MTGNTVIDAFRTIVRDDYRFYNWILQEMENEKYRVILITVHMRENLDEPLKYIRQAIIQLVEKYPDVKIVYPIHLNSAVCEMVYRVLGNNTQVELLDSLDVLDMHNLITRYFMVMIDSGGLQEEAYSFGKLVLVMRSRTEIEHPEAVEAGEVIVAGVKVDDIFMLVSELLSDRKNM